MQCLNPHQTIGFLLPLLIKFVCFFIHAFYLFFISIFTSYNAHPDPNPGGKLNADPYAQPFFLRWCGTAFSFSWIRIQLFSNCGSWSWFKCQKIYTKNKQFNFLKLNSLCFYVLVGKYKFGYVTSTSILILKSVRK